jgi:hypothetical protein
MALNDAQKAELVRKGNTLFNEGKYFEAGKVFTLVGYKTGLVRLGDLFYFEKEMPLIAYGFYRHAKHQPMLEKIGDSFVFALKCLLTDDETPARPKAKNSTEDQFKVVFLASILTIKLPESSTP